MTRAGGCLPCRRQRPAHRKQSQSVLSLSSPGCAIFGFDQGNSHILEILIIFKDTESYVRESQKFHYRVRTIHGTSLGLLTRQTCGVFAPSTPSSHFTHPDPPPLNPTHATPYDELANDHRAILEIVADPNQRHVIPEQEKRAILTPTHIKDLTSFQLAYQNSHSSKSNITFESPPCHSPT